MTVSVVELLISYFEHILPGWLKMVAIISLTKH